MVLCWGTKYTVFAGGDAETIDTANTVSTANTTIIPNAILLFFIFFFFHLLKPFFREESFTKEARAFCLRFSFPRLFIFYLFFTIFISLFKSFGFMFLFYICFSPFTSFSFTFTFPSYLCLSFLSIFKAGTYKTAKSLDPIFGHLTVLHPTWLYSHYHRHPPPIH